MDFGRIEFHPCGEQPASTQPLPKDFFVQYPYLVCTQDVSSSVGLRTRVRILAEEGGATVDVELETIEPLDWVELAGRIRLEGVSLPGVTQGRLEQDRIRWCELVRQGATIGALLFDLGENGYADVATSELSVNWFRQPLEKGVILVGRFAVVIRSEESEEAFRERSQGWLERPTFL